MSNSIVKTLNDCPAPLRMVCIDLIYAGCCAFESGKKSAGRKMVLTAFKAAKLDVLLIDALLKDVPKILAILPAHSELFELSEG